MAIPITLSIDEIVSMQRRGVLDDYIIKQGILYKDFLMHTAGQLNAKITHLEEECERLEEELEDARNNPF